MSQVFRISVLLLGVWTGAHAQQQPATPSRSASSVSNNTAPTNPTTRVLQDARPSDGRQEGAATPQVAIPLKRAASSPIALKPGKPRAPSGTVNDSVARCKAGGASGVQTKCATR